MTCPTLARIDIVLTTAVRLNVSGLSRVDRCCGQAMMRSARIVLRKWFVQEHAFLHRAYNALIDCFVITLPSPAFFRPAPLGDSRISSVVCGAGPHDDGPRHPRHFCRQGDGDLVDVHSALQGIEPVADPALVRFMWVMQDRAPWTSSFLT